MERYRKKPVVIEAEQWFPGDPVDGVEISLDQEGEIQEAWVNTLEGALHVSPGDWIITGVKGEQYPCEPEIFAATYEPVDTPAQGEDVGKEE